MKEKEKRERFKALSTGKDPCKLIKSYKILNFHSHVILIQFSNMNELIGLTCG